MRKEQYSEFAREIVSRLSISDVWAKYCTEPIKRGFVKCPFHDEKSGSMKIYPGTKGFYCFGCGKGGDIIKFVQELFKISFTQAIIRLDNDFGLGLPLDRKLTPREIYAANKRAKEIQAEREHWQAKIRAKETVYWAVFDEWIRLDNNRQDYAPKTIDEELHPLFYEALQKLAHQKYLLDCAEIERCAAE